MTFADKLWPGPATFLLACLFLASGVAGAEPSIFDDPAAMPVPAQPKPVPATTATDPATPIAKIPPPDAAAKAKVLGLIKEVYEKEYGLKTAAARSQLAATMVAEADKVKANFAARYVLLQEAQTAAIAAGDVKDCRKAVEGLGQTFAVDAAALTTESIAKMTAAPESDLLNWAVDAIDACIGREDYRGARRIDSAMATRFAKSTDAALRGRVKAAQATVNESERARLAAERLKSAPDDPAANLTAGRFACFHRHAWSAGLPMLASGSDPKLKEVARKDIANPTDATARYELAAQWWDLSKEKQFATVQDSLRQRANYWYEKALPDLTGLAKTMAEKRLAELPPVGEEQLVNVLNQMVPEGSGTRLTKLPDGTVRLDWGNLQFPTKLTVPFRIDMVVKTTAAMCSIRPHFAGGMIILNWEDNPDEMRYQDPAPGGPSTGYKGKGKIPVDQFVRLTWVVTETGSRILVDGEERATNKVSHKDLSGYFFFNIWNKPSIVVKAIAISSLSSASPPAER